MNCDIFIPVRTNNTRLPGKALKKVNSKPILFYLVSRLAKIPNIRNIVICTTNKKSDDELVDFLKTENIKYFRGSEKDVLNRFLKASEKFDTDFIVNVDGDDIYTDPVYIEKLVKKFEKTNADFIDMEGFPFGFRSVGFTKKALKKICSLKITKITDTGYRDFFIKEPSLRKNKLRFNTKFSKKLRFSLDYQQDLDLAKIVIKKLGNDFHLEDLINLFKNEPKLFKIIEGLDEIWHQHYSKNLSDFSFKT